MADRQRAPSSVGELLKGMALRSGSAFPDFDLVFSLEGIRSRRGRLALTLVSGFAALCLAAALGWTSLVPSKPLIETWYRPLAEPSASPSVETALFRGVSSSQDPLVSYIEVLWDSSLDFRNWTK